MSLVICGGVPGRHAVLTPDGSRGEKTHGEHTPKIHRVKYSITAILTNPP
jgi:hypothetical protein